jgi:hypothetical protein
MADNKVPAKPNKFPFNINNKGSKIRPSAPKPTLVRRSGGGRSQ